MENGVVITETHHGFVCANGGIDASNVGPRSGDVVTLLPRDPDASADRHPGRRPRPPRASTCRSSCRDRFGRPWRFGIVDVAIGVSGLLPLDDLRGTPDADGRVMQLDGPRRRRRDRLGRRAGAGQDRRPADRPRPRRNVPPRRRPHRRRGHAAGDGPLPLATLALAMKVGLQISLVHLAGWPRGHRADARARRSRRRRRRLRLDLGHGPLLPDPRRRRGRGADARGHDRPRLHGRPLDAGPPRPDGRRRPLPQPGPVDQGDDDARRAVRRPGLVRHRRRLERGGVARRSASRSRRSASASRCSRRRSGWPTGCGRASAARRRAFDGRHVPGRRGC